MLFNWNTTNLYDDEEEALYLAAVDISNNLQAMVSSASGREVPILTWEEAEDSGLVLHDTFLCELRSPNQTSCAAFVEAERQDNSGGFYQQQQTLLIAPTSTHQHGLNENRWFDDYISLSEETFGMSSKSLPVTTSLDSYSTGGGHFYSNSFSGFHQTDHQIQDLSGPANTAPSNASSFNFSQLPAGFSAADNSAHPPIPESEYSASFSPPGSAYSSDWSSGSEHSSAVQSHDEIFDEIQRECAEIERQSTSPPAGRRHRAHAKRRSKMLIDQVASTSSASPLSMGGMTERKKELNRIAATKYREKKRREKELLCSEHRTLESRNGELRSIVKELKTEVAYLRKLMKDMEVRARQP